MTRCLHPILLALKIPNANLSLLAFKIQTSLNSFFVHFESWWADDQRTMYYFCHQTFLHPESNRRSLPMIFGGERHLRWLFPTSQRNIWRGCIITDNGSLRRVDTGYWISVFVIVLIIQTIWDSNTTVPLENENKIHKNDFFREFTNFGQHVLVDPISYILWGSWKRSFQAPFPQR